jgi:hypothetical protein
MVGKNKGKIMKKQIITKVPIELMVDIHKRSDEMKLLLALNDIEVLPNRTIKGYSDWIFLPNGRIRHIEDEASISVFHFLKSIS